MEKKHAVISGGMGGVGQAVAKNLSAAGYSVSLLYNASSLSDVSIFLKSLSGTGHAGYACDLTNETLVRDLIQSIHQTVGHIDLLIHAATEPINRKSADQMNTKEFREQFEVSLFGGFSLISSTIPIMREQNAGHIIGILSSFIDDGFQTSRMHGYVASKFALRGLLRSLAHELRGTSIRVNAVAPDLLQTNLSHDLPSRYFEWMAKSDPRGRITTPDDVAQSIQYLLSEDDSLINGSILFVNPPHTKPL